MERKAGFDLFKNARRKAVRLSDEDLVGSRFFDDRRFPLVMEPSVGNVNLISWAGNHRALLDEKLAEHGGILFRGFDLDPIAGFEQFVDATTGGALRYTERSSPRSQVQGKVYTSTDHPPSQPIFLHNEQSYTLAFPLRILFACVLAAESGGETPIADCRRVYQRIDPEIRDRFARRGYTYVRNFGDGFGLTWQNAFQTEDPAEVEEYCRTHDIRFEWKEGNRLRTRQVRRAVARHPVTGEPVWFNHLTFFHVSTLEKEIQESLLSEFSEEDLPNNTYYGDGERIEPEVLDHLREAYRQETVAFPWQQRDVLMLDNMLAAHGRSPFSGPRKVVVAMANPTRWEDIAAA